MARSKDKARSKDQAPRRSAKRRSRRGRPRSRFTPRRWLPFLALIAVTAGAVVIVAQDDPDASPESVRRTAARLPMAAAPGALSTAWYCGGGTARGEGPAEMTVVIANEAPVGASAEIVAVDADGEQVTKTVEVPARGSVRLLVSDLLEARWVATTVEVIGGRAAVSREVAGPHGFDVAPCATEGAEQWYLPSGSTVRGATEILMLYNPFATATSVDITFATDEGPRSPRDLRGLSIPAGSFRLVPSEDLPARRPEVATTVVARTGRVVVDRVQIYDGTGDPVTGDGDDAVTTPAPEGLVSTPAVSTVASRWIFPGGRLSTDSRLRLAIYNPGRKTAEIDVAIGYAYPDRAPEVEPLPVTVRGGEERVVDLTDSAEISPDTSFTIDVRSLEGVPVVAEQVIFGAVPPSAAPTDPSDGGATEAPPDEEGSDEGSEDDATEAPPDDDEPDEGSDEASVGETEPVSAGFAVVAGAPVAATTWFLGDVGISEERVASVVVINPGADAVTVRVDEFDKGTRSGLGSARVEIPAGDRRELDLTGADGSSALLVVADGPVVAGHLIVNKEDVGVSSSLLAPWPETVASLPPIPAADR